MFQPKSRSYSGATSCIKYEGNIYKNHYQNGYLGFKMYLSRYITGMFYIKTVVKTVKLGNMDVGSTSVQWAVHCVSPSLCGVQRGPVNIGK